VRAFAWASAALLLAGCSSTHRAGLDAWGGAQNCHFAHVTKKEFETALRRVFDASRPKAYGLRPAEGGALVEQHWALDVVFGSAVDLERWKLEYARAGDGIDAHVDAEHVQRESVLPVGNGIGPPTAAYQLLWSRLDYVLGNRANWPRCEESARRDPRAPVWSSGLCDTGSDVPPPRLARAH
jgi:hypothetical protein